jgi:tRNA nucleotidyltransferase (CCA-adding enzyme)
MKIFAVGGSVRDKLLGLDTKDRDYVVVGATPQQMIDAGYKAVGADFPVFLHPETKEEYALARTERKVAPGYAGFQFHAAPEVTLVEDLRRRDLTINAMAIDDHGALVDPYGGKKDLDQKLLRHVSDAFVEDPVRVLRVARFAARFAPLAFHVADETMALMRAMVANGEVDHLVPERVWQELARGLMEATPSAMFAVLAECGALARILPEIKTADSAAISALDYSAHENLQLEARFAVLVHHLDEAKIRTLSERIRVPAECRDLALMVARWHADAQCAYELDAEKLLLLFDGTDALRRPERFHQFLAAVGAIYRGDNRGGSTDQNFLVTALTQLQSMNQGAIAATVAPMEIATTIRAAKLLLLQQHIFNHANSKGKP